MAECCIKLGITAASSNHDLRPSPPKTVKSPLRRLVLTLTGNIYIGPARAAPDQLGGSGFAILPATC